MGKTAHEIVTSDRFKALVRKRWTVSVILTILLFVSYYGIILTIAYGKDFLSQKVGEFTNWGIIFGDLWYCLCLVIDRDLCRLGQ